MFNIFFKNLAKRLIAKFLDKGSNPWIMYFIGLAALDLFNDSINFVSKGKEKIKKNVKDKIKKEIYENLGDDEEGKGTG